MTWKISRVACTTVKVVAASDLCFMQDNPVSLSIDLLRGLQSREEVAGLVDKLEKFSVSTLANALSTDAEKIVFWVNVYNSFILIRLRENPEQYQQRKAFFTQKHIRIAGEVLSFDDIEHGFLRKSKMKYSLGYIDKLTVSEFEKRMRVDAVDWRIHMALNCGAVSCPPIYVFTLENLNDRLTERARHYLSASTRYNPVSNQVEVTALMKMFHSDFGGKRGILSILQQFEIIPPNSDPQIRYASYNWELSLDQFVE